MQPLSRNASSTSISLDGFHLLVSIHNLPDLVCHSITSAWVPLPSGCRKWQKPRLSSTIPTPRCQVVKRLSARAANKKFKVSCTQGPGAPNIEWQFLFCRHQRTLRKEGESGNSNCPDVTFRFQTGPIRTNLQVDVGFLFSSVSYLSIFDFQFLFLIGQTGNSSIEENLQEVTL